MSCTTLNHSCVYCDCKNNRSNCTLSFFRFPLKDPERCSEWIQNTGNLRLMSLEITEISNKVICEKHFSPESFRDVIAKRKLLNWNAVPYKYESSPTVTEQRLVYLQEVINRAKDITVIGDCVRSAQHSITHRAAALALNNDMSVVRR